MRNVELQVRAAMAESQGRLHPVPVWPAGKALMEEQGVLLLPTLGAGPVLGYRETDDVLVRWEDETSEDVRADDTILVDSLINGGTKWAEDVSMSEFLDGVDGKKHYAVVARYDTCVHVREYENIA